MLDFLFCRDQFETLRSSLPQSASLTAPSSEGALVLPNRAINWDLKLRTGNESGGPNGVGLPPQRRPEVSAATRRRNVRASLPARKFEISNL